MNIQSLAVDGSGHLFKKQDRPVEVTDFDLPPHRLPLLLAKKPSQSINEKHSSRQVDRLRGLPGPAPLPACKPRDPFKRALSAGVYRPKPAPNAELNNESGNNRAPSNSRNKFILRKKPKENPDSGKRKGFEENPSFPVSGNPKLAKQLNMEQFVKFIHHQYSNAGREGGNSHSQKLLNHQNRVN